MRLASKLKAAGVASRRKCEEIIFDGRVTVNGEVITTTQHAIDENDSVLLDGGPLKEQESKVYYILNKPVGKVCSAVGRKSVLSLFKGEPNRLFTVGRLDKDTDGLLIVTNDGDFANKVIHPSSNISKEYLVKTNKEITHEHLVTMNEGVEIEGVLVRPKKVKKVRRGTFRISVTEGKKHEVRLIAENAGLTVRELTRIRIGGLQLGDLPIGMWRPISEKERRAIYE